MKKTFNVRGMHCAGCSQSVEKSLKKISGVIDADVQLTTEKAVVEFENGEYSFEEIKNTVENAGFELEDEKLEKSIFIIGGMHCAGCVSSVEKAIGSVPGVRKTSVNLATDKAVVEFNPDETEVSLIEKNVQGAGYEITREESKKNNRLEEKRKRDEEKLRSAKNKMIKSWIITAPLMAWMFVDMVLNIHLTSHLTMELAMFAGAGYVIFGPGMETLRSAWKSARVLTPNMDVLIALGTIASLVTGLLALGISNRSA